MQHIFVPRHWPQNMRPLIILLMPQPSLLFSFHSPSYALPCGSVHRPRPFLTSPSAKRCCREGCQHSRKENRFISQIIAPTCTRRATSTACDRVSSFPVAAYPSATRRGSSKAAGPPQVYTRASRRARLYRHLWRLPQGLRED